MACAFGCRQHIVTGNVLLIIQGRLEGKTMQCHVTERTDVTVMKVRYNAVQVKMLLALLNVLTLLNFIHSHNAS